MAKDGFLKGRRKHCEKIIEAIEATIEGRISADIEQLEIASSEGRRQIVKIPVPELIKMRQQYLQELEAISASEGISPGGCRDVLVRF